MACLLVLAAAPAVARDRERLVVATDSELGPELLPVVAILLEGKGYEVVRARAGAGTAVDKLLEEHDADGVALVKVAFILDRRKRLHGPEASRAIGVSGFLTMKKGGKLWKDTVGVIGDEAEGVAPGVDASDPMPLIAEACQRLFLGFPRAPSWERRDPELRARDRNAASFLLCALRLPRGTVIVPLEQVHPPIATDGLGGRPLQVLKVAAVRFDSSGVAFSEDLEAARTFARCAVANDQSLYVRGLAPLQPEQLSEAGKRAAQVVQAAAKERLPANRIAVEISARSEKAGGIEMLLVAGPGRGKDGPPSLGPAVPLAQGKAASAGERPADGKAASVASPAAEEPPKPVAPPKVLTEKERKELEAREAREEAAQAKEAEKERKAQQEKLARLEAEQKKQAQLELQAERERVAQAEREAELAKEKDRKLAQERQEAALKEAAKLPEKDAARPAAPRPPPPPVNPSEQPVTRRDAMPPGQLPAEEPAAVEKPTAAPEKPAAAPEKPTAAPEKPTAAPEKPTAAPEKPSTAAESEGTTRLEPSELEQAEQALSKRADELAQRAKELAAKEKQLEAEEKRLAGPGGKLGVIGPDEKQLASSERELRDTEKRLQSTAAGFAAAEKQRADEARKFQAQLKKLKEREASSKGDKAKLQTRLERLRLEANASRTRQEQVALQSDRLDATEQALAARERRLGAYSKRLSTAGEAPVPLSSGTAGRDQIKAAIDRTSGDIRRCLEGQIKRSPQALRAETVLKIAVDPRGRVSRAQLKGGNLEKSYLEGCLSDAARSWRFPASGEDYELQVPINVVASEGG